MRSRWEVDAMCLANRQLFATKRVTKECPYCRDSFKPAWYPPSPDFTFGSWQQFCSKLCRKLWREEDRAKKDNAL